MPFTSMSEKHIGFFLDDLSKYQKKRTISHQRRIDNVLKSIYNDIDATNNYVNFLYKKNKILFDFKEIKTFNQVEGKSLLDSKYVDNDCFNYIKKNIVGTLQVKTKIENCSIKINYAIFDKKKLNKLNLLEKKLIHALKILRFCFIYCKTKKIKSLNIYLYLTPYEKVLPESDLHILGPSNCNSAVTFACAPNGELLVYRQEEWKKTLIHELFHSLCLDFSIVNYNKIKNKIANLFPVKSEFLLSESYCEYWANILNACFCSFTFLNKKNFDDFVLYAEFCIYIEKMFSLFQVVKILDFMNLKYNHLWEKDKISESYRNILYKEETNIFSYYILKCILLNNDFMLWCYNNNENTLKFDTNDITFNKFFNFIKKYYKSKQFLHLINLMEEKYSKNDNNNIKLFSTLKMTICDYNIKLN